MISPFVPAFGTPLFHPFRSSSFQLFIGNDEGEPFRRFFIKKFLQGGIESPCGQKGTKGLFHSTLNRLLQPIFPYTSFFRMIACNDPDLCTSPFGHLLYRKLQAGPPPKRANCTRQLGLLSLPGFLRHKLCRQCSTGNCPDHTVEYRSSPTGDGDRCPCPFAQHPGCVPGLSSLQNDRVSPDLIRAGIKEIAHSVLTFLLKGLLTVLRYFPKLTFG